MSLPSQNVKKGPDISAMVKKNDTRGLIGALKFPDVAVQKEAGLALTGLGPAATGPLLTALRTKDLVTKLAVIETLGRIRDPRSVDPLIACLKDESNEIRWVAAIALGEIEDPKALEPLNKALHDVDKYVRYGAGFAMSRIGWKPKDQEERAFYFVAIQEWKVCHEIGEASIPALANAMRDRDPEVRMKVLDSLGDIRSRKAEPIILKALSDPNSDVRWRAVLNSQKIRISAAHLPRWLSLRPRNIKNPLIAGFLNFMLPGIGYGYLGKWWGTMLFQIDVTLTLWIYRYTGETNTYTILFPFYLLIGIHAWYMAKNMPEM